MISMLSAPVTSTLVSSSTFSTTPTVALIRLMHLFGGGEDGDPGVHLPAG